MLITPDAVNAGKLPNKKTLNVALLGALSVHLPLPEAEWLKALREAFRPEFFEHNQQAFLSGRAGQTQMKTKTT
jgi:indolepyruvate ferredoxin oxidoreductase beta subunit